MAAGDVNGDGNADLVTAPAPAAAACPRVQRGNPAIVLREFMAFNVAYSGGVFVAAGDLTAISKLTSWPARDKGWGPLSDL